MITDSSWKILLEAIAIFLTVALFTSIWLSNGVVFLGILSLGIWLILFQPKFFVMFISRLVNIPKSVEADRSDFNRGVRLMLLLGLETIHDRFWGFVTKYYPFSMVYRNRLFHNENKDIKTFIHELESYAQKKKLPVIIQSGDCSGDMSLFWVQQSGGKKIKKELFLHKLQEKLQAKYETIYVTPESRGFTIHIPTIMVKGTQQ